MSIRKFLVPIVIILVIVAFYFRTFLFGLLPFPGDLLIAEYNPWQRYSYLGYLPGTFPNKSQYFDTLRQIYPWKSLAIDSLKKGVFPLWNPHNFSGSPLLANFQSGIFYPFNVLYLVFSPPIAWTFLIILESLLSIWGTFLYCKKKNLSTLASFFASITYGFSAYSIVWLEYNTIGQSIAWLPFILLATEYLLEKITVQWFLIYIFSLVSALLSGHPQVAGYIILFSGIYALYHATLSRQKIMFFFLILLSVGISAIQFIPGFELIYYSARSDHVLKDFLNTILIQPWQLVMLFVQDFFGNPATRSYWLHDTYIGKTLSIGIIPLLFLVWNIRNNRGKTPKFFLTAGITVLLLITNNPFTQLFYSMKLPFFSSSSPTLMTFLFSFSLAVLTAYAVVAWQKNISGNSINKIIPLGVIFLFLWGTVRILPKIYNAWWTQNISVATRPLVLETSVFVLATTLLFLSLMKKRLTTLVLISVLLLHIGDLWIGFQKFNPFVSKDLLYPGNSLSTYLSAHTGIDRIWGLGSASIEANFATKEKLYSTDGYDPLYPRWYGEFIHASQNGKLLSAFNDSNRSDAFIARSSGNDLSVNIFRKRILDTLGVKYIIDRPENGNSEKTLEPSLFLPSASFDGWKIFINTGALPRMFLVSHYETYASRNDFASKFFSTTFRPSDSVLLEKAVPYPLSEASSHEVKLISYKDNEIFVITQSDGNELLFLSDTFYPGWNAYLDGRKEDVIKADYAFRAVYIPKGKHSVRFVYDPLSFRLGSIISLLSVFGTIAFCVYIKKQ